jgi:leader peptidase (prepilin peptidase) / N-methyltransferase
MPYIASLFGLIVGSFLGVLIDRLPKGQDVIWGRSHCDFCKRNLRWYELIPVFSFVVLRGRCLRCKKKLSFLYPVIELITAAGFGLLYVVWGASMLTYIGTLIVFCSLVVIVFADFQYQIIPDSMIVLGLVGTALWLFLNIPPRELPSYALAGVGAAAFFYILWRVTKGRGMGFGDVKLALFLGLILGYPGIVISLYIAFLTGAAVGVILILTGGKTLKSKIAFGPFMVFGALGSILFQKHILILWKTFF